MCDPLSCQCNGLTFLGSKRHWMLFRLNICQLFCLWWTEEQSEHHKQFIRTRSGCEKMRNLVKTFIPYDSWKSGILGKRTSMVMTAIPKIHSWNNCLSKNHIYYNNHLLLPWLSGTAAKRINMTWRHFIWNTPHSKWSSQNILYIQ